MIAFALTKATSFHTSGDAAYTSLVAQILPHGIRGIVACGMLTALMASLASKFNASATLFTTPICSRVLSRAFADGGGYTQTSRAANGVFNETHVASTTLINEFRLAGNWMHVERVQAYGNDLNDIPGEYGITGVPQLTGNGGLSTINVGIYSQLGSSPYLYANDNNQTIQVSDSFSKIHGARHTIKGGVEAMEIRSPTIQPPYSRGEFDFSGNYTSIPNALDASTGAAQFVLIPARRRRFLPSGDNYVGGPNQVLASNIVNIDNRRNYVAAYLQDEWKKSPKLTITLGARWEYFQPWKERYSAEANFIPGTSA